MMRRKTTVVLAFVLAAVGLAVWATPSLGQEETAPTTEAAEGGRSISGTIRGIDGNFVNAQISLVLRDRLDRPIHMNGQVHTNRGFYEVNLSMNPTIPLEGDPNSGDATWQINGFPANAHHFTLEVYPRAAGSGAGNFTHYGGAVKRNLVLPPGQNLNHIDIRFPLHCNVPGGTTGSIRIRRYVNGNPAGNLSKFVATGADFPPFGINGFRDQRDIPPGESAPEFDALAPNRRYGVEIFVPGSRYTFFEVPVRECQRTDVIIWSGSPSPVPPRFASQNVSPATTGFPASGDFDGDGDDDIYFYLPNGAPGEMWTSDGSGTGFVKTPLMANGSHRLAPGDFNGDGIDDLFFYGGGTRPDRIWQFAANGSYTEIPATANMGGSQTYPVVGDYDFNGRDDIIFVSPNGSSTMRRFTAAGHTDRVVNFPRGFKVRAGDFDGDWQADLILYRPLQHFGEVQAWFTNNNATTFRKVGYRVRPAQFQPILGDVSGDFKADIIWYQPGGAIDVLWRGRAPEEPYFSREDSPLGINGNFIPVSGDWNGDGTDDVFFYGPGGGVDKIWRSNQPAWLIQQRWPAP